MNIETIQEIKDISTELLKAKKKLEKLNDSYCKKTNLQGFSRALTTTYNANTADIIINIVKPCEEQLKKIIN